MDLYKRLSGAIAANPNMSVGEMRAVEEHVGDATAEPGGVDYIEVDAAGVLAMWAVPKNCAEDRALRSTVDGKGWRFATNLSVTLDLLEHVTISFWCLPFMFRLRLRSQSLRHQRGICQHRRALQFVG